MVVEISKNKKFIKYWKNYLYFYVIIFKNKSNWRIFMADINLFSLSNGVNELPSKSVALEKEKYY